MTLDEIKVKFQSELQRKNSNPRSRRYSKELRKAVTASIRLNGYTMTAVRSTLGVSSTALSKWISTDLVEGVHKAAPQQEDFIAAKIMGGQEVPLQRLVTAGEPMKLYLPNGVRLDFNC
ncbi:MAG TPA: transposase [Oligoflexus sp.]|uniref:transposase n=1 Tax=Oligoflexus sp. TaxID=1971216 RepID=UPI002D6957E7|nr:transposase [Oligoflexus sp.]HYX38295.1 transposase [Oligoflexus sp.]